MEAIGGLPALPTGSTGHGGQPGEPGGVSKVSNPYHLGPHFYKPGLLTCAYREHGCCSCSNLLSELCMPIKPAYPPP